MRAFAIVGAALVLTTAVPARADDGGYGERILAIDGTSDALILAGLFGESDPLLYVGLAGHVLGGPIVHLSHGNPGRAALSLGTRVGLPAATGLFAYAVCDADDSGFLGCIGPVAIAVAFGFLAAQIIDPALIVPDAETTPAMLTIRF